MIHYVVTGDNAYTMRAYLQTWGRRLWSRVDILPYERLACFTRLARGTYIFSDLERLDGAGMDLARLAWRTLADAGRSVLLNDPHRVMRREALLRALHASGRNPFAVHRAADGSAGVRWPAFVRRASRHDGALTPLLHTPEALAASVAALVAAGHPIADLLAVEFCDTADAAGTYRKYSAMRVGRHLIPRHLFLGPGWMLKHADDIPPAAFAEEAAFLSAHPHAADLTATFDLAAIDYGRIDYAILNGRPVTWEINTNPVFTADPATVLPAHLPPEGIFARAVGEALTELADATAVAAAGPTVRFAVPRRLRSANGQTPVRRAMRHLGRGLELAGRFPPVARLLSAAKT